eukprot:Opistho-2@13863
MLSWRHFARKSPSCAQTSTRGAGTLRRCTSSSSTRTPKWRLSARRLSRLRRHASNLSSSRPLLRSRPWPRLRSARSTTCLHPVREWRRPRAFRRHLSSPTRFQSRIPSSTTPLCRPGTATTSLRPRIRSKRPRRTHSRQMIRLRLPTVTRLRQMMIPSTRPIPSKEMTIRSRPPRTILLRLLRRWAPSRAIPLAAAATTHSRVPTHLPVVAVQPLRLDRTHSVARLLLAGQTLCGQRARARSSRLPPPIRLRRIPSTQSPRRRPLRTRHRQRPRACLAAIRLSLMTHLAQRADLRRTSKRASQRPSKYPLITRAWLCLCLCVCVHDGGVSDASDRRCLIGFLSVAALASHLFCMLSLFISVESTSPLPLLLFLLLLIGAHSLYISVGPSCAHSQEVLRRVFYVKKILQL